MKYEMPSKEELKAIGDELGFDMDDQYVTDVLSFMEPFADSFNAPESTVRVNKKIVTNC